MLYISYIGGIYNINVIYTIVVTNLRKIMRTKNFRLILISESQDSLGKQNLKPNN